MKDIVDVLQRGKRERTQPRVSSRRRQWPGFRLVGRRSYLRRKARWRRRKRRHGSGGHRRLLSRERRRGSEAHVRRSGSRNPSRLLSERSSRRRSENLRRDSLRSGRSRTCRRGCTSGSRYTRAKKSPSPTKDSRGSRRKDGWFSQTSRSRRKFDGGRLSRKSRAHRRRYAATSFEFFWSRLTCGRLRHPVPNVSTNVTGRSGRRGYVRVDGSRVAPRQAAVLVSASPRGAYH
jgi:hypothetical protein